MASESGCEEREVADCRHYPSRSKESQIRRGKVCLYMNDDGKSPLHGIWIHELAMASLENISKGRDEQLSKSTLTMYSFLTQPTMYKPA